ncbi:uncharacterized protein KY384_000685 [Bacidia gigantensis]|uniref:uncharacterized protein n=1 Tax=Bacidia gigantensis TaxID=2732470 RepID=UPI001D046345|nr:uncharacterized protein KY384_000685 [Bacidia gigantensis]KAG8525923.1 hypothetical protein KY384_000685 [Bacidia gigantensis]
MIALCRKPLGSSESGTLRASLDIMRGEVESMGKAHQGIAGQMKSELEEPLAAFAGGMKERRKIVQAGAEKLFKIKQQQTQAANKSRDKYEQDCLKIKGYLAQGHMVMGQEERKNKAKMEKTQIQLASTGNEYEAAIKVLEETTGRWNREWKAACDKFQDLEEERLDFMKSSLWTFANIASTVCVSDDAVEKDISIFIQERGTGQEIPDPPKYIDFCRGDAEDNASAHSDDDYSVAQFQRTINPAFRTSSPQPSTFESHHDPGSDLAARMGHEGKLPPQKRDVTLTPQSNRNGQHVIAQQSNLGGQPPVQSDIQDFAAVPHNEYPTDGMTMFCRTAPPSDRSSATSPNRPSSRDSQSEYSNPTSFSSVEPTSGSQSPIKGEYGQGAPGNLPNKAVQKKRSGFFSNSPFRRKSKHEKGAPSLTTPTSRSNWRSSNDKQGEVNRPSFTTHGGQDRNIRDANSGTPEPVDPRAQFQLNVGNNVFDVASPDSKGTKSAIKGLNRASKGLDPIAAALEELKGVNKQSSVRMSADRYAGVATPGPASVASTQHNEPSAARRKTPPPSYDQPTSRLGAPKPAFTSAQMQQTTRKYVNQGQDIYGASRGNAREKARDIPRATSPRPMRSTSPRPPYQGRENTGLPRSASPNPYGGSKTRQTPNTSPSKGSYSAHGSPNDRGRVPSPQPQFARQDRPHSSGNMAVQLADGAQQGRRGNNDRPMSYYGGQRGPQPGAYPSMERPRAKSAADGRNFTAEGKPILQMARALYMYRAAIPEELSFGKGDMLAVTRYQDDGWWEAAVSGKNGRPGLVPSNYLQPC